MMEQQQSVAKDVVFWVGMPTMLSAIENVLELCDQAQEGRPDPAISYAICELNRIRDAVAHAWPLPPELKRQIDLGPFAVKNIEDWNEGLAGALVNLDYSLQHDGAHVEKVMREEPGKRGHHDVVSSKEDHTYHITGENPTHIAHTEATDGNVGIWEEAAEHHR